MIAGSLRLPARALLFALALTVFAGPARAQPQPSANAIAIAKEIITIKGSADFFYRVGSDVIEQVKLTFLQINPMIGKDLNEVAARLRTEYAARSAQLLNEIAKLYASRFTEQELKDALAFYKTPLGRKLIAQEPQVMQESMEFGKNWADKFGDEVLPRFRAEMKKRGHDL